MALLSIQNLSSSAAAPSCAEEGGLYPLNVWYAAAFSHELKAGAPIARAICDKHVVLYRTETGEAVALQDRCVHRGMPLSVGGKIEGDAIRCPYHGLLFDKSGACTEIPGQDRVPPTAKVKAYPLVERDALLWIWMGDPELADPATAPSYEYHSSDKWAYRTATYEFEADYLLLLDNLMDLTHVGYVHKMVGGDQELHSDAKTTVRRDDEHSVIVAREIPNCPAPPQYQNALGGDGRIDRWQDIYFHPSRIWIWSGGQPAGTGAFEGTRAGAQFMTFHAIAPVTKGRCRYHFTVAWNFDIDNEEVAQKMFDGANFTVLEDKVVIEAQSKRLVEDPDILLDIRSDAGQLQVRRALSQIMEAERAARAAAAA